MWGSKLYKFKNVSFIVLSLKSFYPIQIFLVTNLSGKLLEISFRLWKVSIISNFIIYITQLYKCRVRLEFDPWSLISENCLREKLKIPPNTQLLNNRTERLLLLERKSGYSNGCYKLARTRAANNLSGQSLNEF